MSGCDEDQENLIEEPKPENKAEAAPSDDDDDWEGYFLQPAGNSVNTAEKIAEANKKLLEEEEDDENRPRKVQFNEEVVNFEPPPDYSDEDYIESARNSIISEDLEVQINQEEETSKEKLESSSCSVEIQEESPTIGNTEPDLVKQDEDEIDEIVEELDTEVKESDNTWEASLNERSNKLLLVLLPKEQNSSCESIIGEEIAEEKDLKLEVKEVQSEPEKVVKAKIVRPKSACTSKYKKSCEVAKISPNLNYSSNLERKSWQGSRNPLIRPKSNAERDTKKVPFESEVKAEVRQRVVKKINIDNLNLEALRNGGQLKTCCDNRPKSSVNWRGKGPGESRPKTAPMKRTCCVIRSHLPNYNGLRSEYGLSAEQLQERKQRTLEIKHQKQQDKLKERQEKLRKRNENEEIFQRWLFNKRKKSLSKKPNRTTDTLTRSDVYIQAHASYAANTSVSYSVDYNLNKKVNKKSETVGKKTNKTIIVEKLLDKVSPHFKRSFNIYLGTRQ